MCNERKQSNSDTKASKDITLVNKQRTNIMKSTNDMCTNENQTVDFHIHTNLQVLHTKRIHLCFLISLIIGFVCIFGCFFAVYKLNIELKATQAELTYLNKKFISLSDKCEALTDDVVMDQLKQDENPAYEMVTSTDQTVEDLYEDDYETEVEDNISLGGRSRRANTRSRANARHVKSSGSLAAHFKGSKPEATIDDQGLIGPWYHDQTVSRSYKFPKFHLTEGKCAIEVTEQALYFIYAQIYYVTSSAVSSYSVYVRSEGSSTNNIIAKCSASGPSTPQHMAEMSCFTAAVYHLKANDRIFIRQTEKNRTIVLRDGHSFFGIVRLNNSRKSRH